LPRPDLDRPLDRGSDEILPQQDDALKAVSRWLKAPDRQLFRLFGYAGTGKTTLARHFAEDIDGHVQFAAFTGKAAQVLRARGATNARTIHSLIYRPRGEEADPTRRPARPRCRRPSRSTARARSPRPSWWSWTNARWSTRRSAAT
jgi:MoxR-like ATPase